MHEFQHYALESDSFAILKELLADGFTAIPEEPILREPKLARFATYVPEIEDKLRKYPALLLEGTFTKYPLEFGRRDGGEAAGTYYADQMSGPRIRWSLAGLNTSGRPWLSPGSISYAGSYRNPTTKGWESPDAELKEAFKKMVIVVKRHMTRIPIGREHVWIGKAAKDALDAGRATLER